LDENAFLFDQLGIIRLAAPEELPPGTVLLPSGPVTVGSGRTVDVLVLGLLFVAPVVPGSGILQPVKRLAISRNTRTNVQSFFI
jgi:hypothetical protein